MADPRSELFTFTNYSKGGLSTLGQLCKIYELTKHLDREEERVMLERDERLRKSAAEEKANRQRRLLAGADLGRIQPNGSQNWYCRKNGRLYRAVQERQKYWTITRVRELSDQERDVHVGQYGNRREATKAIEKLAFQPDIL